MDTDLTEVGRRCAEGDLELGAGLSLELGVGRRALLFVSQHLFA